MFINFPGFCRQISISSVGNNNLCSYFLCNWIIFEMSELFWASHCHLVTCSHFQYLLLFFFITELLAHKSHFKQKWSFLPTESCYSIVSFTYDFGFNAWQIFFILLWKFPYIHSLFIDFLSICMIFLILTWCD